LISYYQEIDFHFAEARCLIDLGDALMSRGLSADREQAIQTYRQALDMYIAMDAP